MSPSSSVPQAESLRKQPHSRHSSLNQQIQETKTSKNSSSTPPPLQPSPQVYYTCFIRLPFPRGDFEDPPPVEWDSAKDRALWKLISKASKSKDLDWEEISVNFKVSLPFLLQQAAWLYERHFEGMKKQMQKLGVSGTATPVSGDVAGVSGIALHKAVAKDARGLTALSTRKDSPILSGDVASTPGTPRLAHPISRTPSSTTVTQSRMQTSTSRQPVQRAFRGSGSSMKRPAPPARPIDMSQDDDEYALGDRPSASESEEEPSAIARSQAHKRAPPSRKRVKPPKSTDEDDSEDNSSGGYLPFAATSKTTKFDPAATPRESHQQGGSKPTTSGKAKGKELMPDSSESSVASAQPQPSSTGSNSGQRPGPLSPKHRAQLARLSPGSKGNASDGSPSMGSSFSDLDDASVTKSALEEALLSNMQHGGSSMASRMGSIRDALKR